MRVQLINIQPIKLVLGTMNFGPQLDLKNSESIVNKFIDFGYNELDTAYVYNNGDSEKYIGEMLPNLRDEIVIATKVNPRISGRLDGEAVKFQLEESLQRMKKKSIDLLYFHFPDKNTPIESALEMCANLYEQGKLKNIGLSNFPAWQVVDIWHKCEKSGCPKPIVYQGIYNAFSRNVEKELFPALRELGMKFYAYNPLAGGLLTNKYTDFSEEPSSGRFTVRPNYKDRYWKKKYFNSLIELNKLCSKENISVAEAAIRWLAYHSKLNPKKDAILLGTSKLSQLEQNVNAARNGKLPEMFSVLFEEIWEKNKAESPDYFRYPIVK